MVVVVVCVAVKSPALNAEPVSTAGVVSPKLVFTLKSFKAEVAPTIELLEVKSKLFVSTLGSTDWKVLAL